VPALRDLSFEVDPGECLLVVGPSGSGKSTLALAIAGLVPREIPGVFGRTLQVDDVETRHWPDAALAARVGLVFQDPGSQIVMERVEDDVAFGLENRGWSRAAMLARVPAALAAVGLEGLERHRSTRLSGGQQQRLALAGVLAAAPGILILDEPTANLDPDAATDLFARLAELRASRTTTIVLVEHRVEAAWPLADRVLALGRQGEQIDVGRPEEVLGRSGERMQAEGIWLPERGSVTMAGMRGTRVAGAGLPGGTGPGPSVVAEGPGWDRDGWGTASHALVRAGGVRFGYEAGTPVVRDIAFEAAAGERIALVGPNGSGKSTLGRLLVGLLRPERGRIELSGADPARMPPAELARRAGYVFQDPESQFLAERVEDEIMLGLRPDERAGAAELLDRLDLPLARYADRSPYRLSGGEARRLSLACVLVRRPGLLVLDEPTFGQDRLGYEALVGIVDERIQAGTCLIAATHDERFVADVADRVVEMQAGWIVRDDAVEGAA
jgi:energy-coupling factor transporter ATP-binding protein EcfA2